MLRPSSLARVSLSVNIALHQLKSKKKERKTVARDTEYSQTKVYLGYSDKHMLDIVTYPSIYFFFPRKRSALISGVDILKLFRFSDITNQI